MNILYSDEHILIINKPAGLPVLPDGWEKDAPYLVKSLEEGYGRIFIVHRLDKITSGVMVFARDAETHRALNIHFENHQAGQEARRVYPGPTDVRLREGFSCYQDYNLAKVSILRVSPSD